MSSQSRLGDYVILEKIAHGGMAEIFKAKTADPGGIERLVVIKRILPHISSHPEYIEMLVDEAKIAVHFNHGNIAQVYDLGRLGTDYFIVMEYVDGKTLGQILKDFKARGKQIPLPIILYTLIELCAGLDYLHRKTDANGKPLGVVHRDISPQNIIISYSGTVKIIDFGVAKSTDKLSTTESGVLKGKFAYMSPEQADGLEIDRRSDLFSAGTLMWELLTMERLFKRKTNPETIRAVKAAKVVAPSQLRSEVPRTIDAIVRKALSRKARHRYQNAAEMAHDLTAALFQLDPDFRPLKVVEFLYEHFGPEKDEEGLPPELPQLATKAPLPLPAEVSPDEEKTEIETIVEKKISARRWIWISGLTAGVCGTLLFFLFIYPWWVRACLEWHVTPAAAQVKINGVVTQLNNPQCFAPRDNAHVTAAATGFKPFETHLTMSPRERKVLQIVLEKEIPPFGDIFIETDPPGAKVMLGESEWIQTTPTRLPHLKNGQAYQITLSLPGYKSIVQEITITGGEEQKINARFEMDTAELEIISSPPGAHVMIDGQDVGTTPYALNRIQPGETIIFEMILDGYQSKKESVSFQAGEKKKLNYNLDKMTR